MLARRRVLSVFPSLLALALLVPALMGSCSVAAKTDTIPPALVSATVTTVATAPSYTSPNGTGSLVKLAQGNNAFVALLELSAGATIPQHRDKSEEYIHVLTGGGTLTIDGTAYELEPGSTVFMPAGSLVSFANGSSPMTALQVFADPQSAGKYAAWTPGQ